MNFFKYESKLKIRKKNIFFFFFLGGGGEVEGGGLELVCFFLQRIQI